LTHPSSLCLALDTLEDAHEALWRLPLTNEVQALHRRGHALRIVLHDIASERATTTSEAQRTNLLASVTTFVRDVEHVALAVA